MTEVSFHFNVADRLHYTCRLLRKVVRLGHQVDVRAPRHQLGVLDQALWTFEDTEFVPHVRWPESAELPERLQETPVWLLEEAVLRARDQVLLTWCEEPPKGFESYARVIEVVSRDDAERESARRRWKYYAQRGYTIEKHEATD